jgi:4-amino-4-deoxy-L-arabinose transferase-like glycosyltransferase
MWNRFLNNQQTPFWLFAFSILIGLTLPTLIKDGMFMDAMLYTCVSHNLSMGIGTFWFPQFSLHNVAGLSSFHEQPPLVFGIQSLFFRLLGDSMYVERFYTFTTLVLSAMLIVLLWKEVFKDELAYLTKGWLPLIFWITIPVCFWSYSNNMHENTLTIFTLLAVLFSLKAFRAEKYSFLLMTLSGLAVFLATLSKGLPGLFPIGVPLLYWIITGKIRFSAAFVQTLIIVLVPALFYTLLLLFPESRESLSIYFFKRALHRINEVPTVDSRFYILGRLLMELIPQFILVVVFLIIGRIRKINLRLTDHLREIIFFLAVGLSASLPLMLTLVQKGFYFVPALPYFATGLAMLIVPVVSGLTHKNTAGSKLHRNLLIASSLLLLSVATFSFAQVGKTGRNKELLHDVYLIGKIVPQHSVVSIPIGLWNAWDLQCYLIRYYNISLETGKVNWYSIRNSPMPEDSVFLYRRIEIPTQQYHLYSRK